MLSFYERAYNERDKTESGSFAREYLAYFLSDEPSPGIEYEYRLVQQVMPGITLDEVSALVRARLSRREPRRPRHRCRRRQACRSRQRTKSRTPSARPRRRRSRSGPRRTAPRELLAKKPAPATVSSRRELADLGVTIVRFSNGVEAWLKPTDFKNDQVLFTMYAPGGASLAAPEDFTTASLATSYVGLSGAGGIKANRPRRSCSPASAPRRRPSSRFRATGSTDRRRRRSSRPRFSSSTSSSRRRATIRRRSR